MKSRYFLLLIIIPLTIHTSPTKSKRNAIKIGKIVTTHGKAHLKRDNTIYAIKTESNIYNNDRITTRSNGSIEIKLINNSILKISKNTSVILSTQMNQKGQLSRIALIYGQIKAKILKKKHPNNFFSIQTASATCGVRGTVFTVANGLIPGTLVSVIDGKIFLKTKKQSTILKKGYSSITSLLDKIKTNHFFINTEKWLQAQKKEILRFHQKIIQNFKDRIDALQIPSFITEAKKILQIITGYYSKISDLLKKSPPLNFIQRKIELPLLQAAAKILYPIKEKVHRIRIFQGKLKNMIIFLNNVNKPKLSIQLKVLQKKLLQANSLLSIVNQVESFYRKRMIEYQ